MSLLPRVYNSAFTRSASPIPPLSLLTSNISPVHIVQCAHFRPPNVPHCMPCRGVEGGSQSSTCGEDGGALAARRAKNAVRHRIRDAVNKIEPHVVPHTDSEPRNRWGAASSELWAELEDVEAADEVLNTLVNRQTLIAEAPTDGFGLGARRSRQCRLGWRRGRQRAGAGGIVHFEAIIRPAVSATPTGTGEVALWTRSRHSPWVDGQTTITGGLGRGRGVGGESHEGVPDRCADGDAHRYSQAGRSVDQRHIYCVGTLGIIETSDCWKHWLTRRRGLSRTKLQGRNDQEPSNKSM
jgi:hypothetical protein